MPLERVCPTPPFIKVIVDLAGHLLVNPILSPRAIIKVWILIYLCDMSKALHIEVVDSMTSSAIINAFRSYFVIRDTPAQISNDPGKYFLGAKIIMQKEFSSVAHDFVDYWPSIGLFTPQNFCGEMGQLRPILNQLKSSFKMLQNFKLALLEFKTLIDPLLLTTDH